MSRAVWTPCLLLALMAATLACTTPAGAEFIEEEQFGTRSTIPVAWGDYDNDGDPDLAVGNFMGANQLFINNGDGTFTEEQQFSGYSTFAVAWGDYDNDGDPDLAVGKGYNQQSLLFVNNGDGTFTEEAHFGSARTIAVAWGDYDSDGDLDLAVGNGILGHAEANQLFVNNGDGTFAEEAQFGAGQSGSVVWGDFDNDGDLDLAVGNGGFGSSEQNYLYVNHGDGTFTERAEFGIEDTACLYWGDYNSDGHLDIAVGNWNDGQNYLYVNNGDGTFSQHAQFGARDTNTLSWGDSDNDGDLDVAVGNGDFSSADQNFLYINNGDGTFSEQAEFGMGSTDGVAWGDYNGDGDLDLALGNEHSSTQNYLYVNDEGGDDYLVLHLVGHFHDLGTGYSNRDGVGAKVTVYETGFLGDPDHILAYREICAHGGFASQNAIEAHLGLSGILSVDVRIAWAGSGGSHIIQDLEGLAVGQSITVEEMASADVPDRLPPRGESGFLQAVPNPMREQVSLVLDPSGLAPRRLEIRNVMGQIVRTLELKGPNANGLYGAEWDGRTGDGGLAPAGLYLMHGQGLTPRSWARVLLLR